LTLEQLSQSMLVLGPQPARPDWDTVGRLRLVSNLGIVVGQLRQVGITDIFIAGSFVQDKPNPDDIDGYYVINPLAYAAQHQRLMQINPLIPLVPVQSTWEYIASKGKARPLLCRDYRIELFSELNIIVPGTPGSWSHFFRHTRDGRPKGIVRII
jgi:hypothetical protein